MCSPGETTNWVIRSTNEFRNARLVGSGQVSAQICVSTNSHGNAQKLCKQANMQQRRIAHVSEFARRCSTVKNKQKNMYALAHVFSLPASLMTAGNCKVRALHMRAGGSGALGVVEAVARWPHNQIERAFRQHGK